MNGTVEAAPSLHRSRPTYQRVPGSGIHPEQQGIGGVLPAINGESDRDPHGPGRSSGHPPGPAQSVGEAAAPTPPLRRLAENPAPASGLMRSVLICDDRADVRLELSTILRLSSQAPVRAVADGFALLDAYQKAANDQVLIGVHSGTTVGGEAVSLLLQMHPEASPIVFRSITDIDLLAGAYASGGAGLLLWEPGQP